MGERLALHVEASCAPERFVRLAAGLAENGPGLLVASLSGDAILLGRHQRGTSALEREVVERAGVPVFRRSGGGRALHVGEGVVGVALSLRLGAVQGGATADKLINRTVRYLLGGLTRASGAPVHYFGRDFVSVQSRALAFVSQDGTGSGAAILEAYVAVERTLELRAGWSGYPEHGDPRAAGPAPIELAELATPPRLSDFAGWIGEAVAAASGAELTPGRDLEEAPPPGPAPFEDETGFGHSGVADVPIGFVEALCRHEGGRLVEARLRGDFIAPAFVVRALEASLPGTPLDFAALGRKVDLAFHLPHAALLGVRHMRVFADAILAAALGAGPPG